MIYNCRLNRNISFSQPGSADSCDGRSLEGIGGISKVVVYNIDDVPSLKFDNDNRVDESLYVDTINSTGQFYTIDFTSATYQEAFENGKWTHTLTLDIQNISTLFEDILADGTNGRYFVCFKPNGGEDWRAFGWKYGAKIGYSMNIQSDSLGYTVTFEDVSEYPLFGVNADNFGDKNKVYTPIFKPLYDVYFCEQSDGHYTGYLVAMYATKVNAVGQPLDSDNKLCQWSGKKQDAYKYSSVSSDGGYNILGTYASSATFDGRPVRILDYDKCSASVTNSIFINQKKNETIELNSTVTTRSFIITSNNNWIMLDDPRYVSITPRNGGNGNTTCYVTHNGVGGTDEIRFLNTETREIVTLIVNVYIISTNTEYIFPYGTTEFILTPTAEGGSKDYTYTVSPSLSVSKDSNKFLVCHPNVSASEQNFRFTLVHVNDNAETKVIDVKILGNNVNPSWQVLSSNCEIV